MEDKNIQETIYVHNEFNPDWCNKKDGICRKWRIGDVSQKSDCKDCKDCNKGEL